ncbi:hypothetical protein ACF1BE_27965 [Streptomyces sp. NPDC014991]|uniref:hypothetical protein n=1 Tax=Streptomyces sp. NPDC014991 TaxID=3364935 RepID=UPI0036FB3D49
MAEQKSSSVLTAPLRGAASVLRRVPGAGTVGRAAEGTLDKVGAVSPRGRRIAVYAGAGLLGAAGVVESPVAVTGAAVAWLTQPRPAQRTESGPGAGDTDTPHREPAHDLGTAALRSGGEGDGPAPAEEKASERRGASAEAAEAGNSEASVRPEAAPEGAAPAPTTSPGPLGPTVRPDRTTL